MANRIYMKMFNRVTGEENYILDSPLQEDIPIELNTTFQDVSELFPSGLDTILSLYKTKSAVIGSTAKGFEDLIGQPIWQKTDPLKLSLSLIFYTKDKPFEDVLVPTLSLCALTTLTDIPAGMGMESVLDKKGNDTGKQKKTTSTTYALPGIQFADVTNIRGKNTAESMTSSKDYSSLFQNGTKSTVCSVLIPGVIFLPVALVTSAKPTFSKEVVRIPLSFNVCPLWAKVDIEIRSITPSSLSMITSQLYGEGQFSSRGQFTALRKF